MRLHRPKPAPIEKLDRYVVAFAVIGLGFFAWVLAVSLWNARPW